MDKNIRFFGRICLNVLILSLAKKDNHSLHEVMGKTLNLSQLDSFQDFTTEFSMLGDDYVFTRITETNSAAGAFFSEGPMRFEGMSWLLCFGGKMTMEVNLSPVILKSNSVAIIRPDSFIDVKNIEWEKLDCYVLLISRNFLRDINFDLNILGAIPVPISSATSSVVHDISLEETKLLKEYYDILHHNTRNSDSLYSKSIARCVIAALTYQLIQIFTRQVYPDMVERSRSRRSVYVHDFIELVHEHHRRERSVSFYAEKLFISPKYLSLIVKEALGRSAADIIDDYVILEAKNMLRFSDRNIQQVSYDLNFPNQSSFGKYFKHLVGMSPSEYQRST